MTEHFPHPLQPVATPDQLRQLAQEAMRAFPELAEVLSEITGPTQ